MFGVFEAIVDALMAAAGYIVTAVRTITLGVLNTIWGIVKYVAEFVWNYTIGLASTTLVALLAAFGVTIDVDLSQFRSWVELANYWLPISESMVISKGLYAFYLSVTAYKWIKWAVPWL